ncbi:unnamed protein product [Arctogadus glacialis]
MFAKGLSEEMKDKLSSQELLLQSDALIDLGLRKDSRRREGHLEVIIGKWSGSLDTGGLILSRQPPSTQHDSHTFLTVVIQWTHCTQNIHASWTHSWPNLCPCDCP